MESPLVAWGRPGPHILDAQLGGVVLMAYQHWCLLDDTIEATKFAPTVYE